MSKLPPGEGSPVPANPNESGKEWPEGRNVTQIATMLAEKLSHDEFSDLVLAIESENLHEAIIQQWKNMDHPKTHAES